MMPELEKMPPEIKEIFHSVDFLFAKRIGKNVPFNTFLLISYLLKTAREGHLCVVLRENQIFPSCDPSLNELLVEGAKHIDEQLMGDYLVRRENRIYLRRNWECEEKFLKNYLRLKNQTPTVPIPQDTLERNLDRELLEVEQKAAIMHAATNGLSVICGGPGTGKTYTAAMLIRHFLPFLKGEIIVVAPTGKATANLRRWVGENLSRCKIQTLHSFLRGDHLADLILVDEGSMVDAELMAELFSSVRNGARLVLFGDRDQLPPVESGNFFSDIARDKDLGVTLHRCLRVELQGMIQLAECVKKGEVIPSHPLPDLKELIQKIADRFSDPRHCVLTPLRRGTFGVNHLNQLLMKEHLKRGGQKIPIMITKNDPSLELFNGDTGLLSREEGCAYFGERRVAEYLLPPYEYAYVLSIHKSQGSEYDEVMILLPKGSEVFGREMLYTAITRARRGVEIFAEESVIEGIVSKHSQRLSGLFQHKSTKV